MKSKTFMMLSVGALSVALGAPASAQGQAGDTAAGQGLAPDQIKQMRKWQKICEEGGKLPGKRDCESVLQALENAGLLDGGGAQFGQDEAAGAPASDAAPAPEAEDAPADAAEAPEAEKGQQGFGEAPAPAPEQDAAEAPAPKAEQDAAESRSPEAETVEKDADGSPLPEAIDDAKQDAAESPFPKADGDAQPDAAEAPAPEVDAAEKDAEGSPFPEATDDVKPEAAEAPAPEADDGRLDAAEAPEPNSATRPKARAEAEPEPPVQEPDPQAQADAVQRMDDTPPAAATADRNSGKRTEETITENDVRRSNEDFLTNLAEGLRSGARTGDRSGGDKAEDDRDGMDPAAGAALLGLGALALNQILDNGDRVVSNTGDRVVVEQNGQYRVLRNDDVLLRRPGAEVDTTQFDDGSTRNTVTYDDGTVVETIRAADGRVLRRTRTLPNGEAYVLFDDTKQYEDVEVNRLPQVGDQTRERIDYRQADDDALTRALQTQRVANIDRDFSLAQVRNIDTVRHLVPVITVDTINFETGSAAIRVEEAEELAALGNAMRDAIDRNPAEVFLIEGHTDAVGSYAYNLALSDRRAESVALALTEYFDVPPENMVLQGYGESDLLVPTNEAERANRRAAVRRITPLLTDS